MFIFLFSADDMGLGKTLTMISLLLKTKEERENKVIVEEDADSEENDESESSWLLKRRKCKYYCPTEITFVLLHSGVLYYNNFVSVAF